MRLDVEIKLIKDKLSSHTNSEEYKECSINLKLLEKKDIEQKIKRRKKLIGI